MGKEFYILKHPLSIGPQNAHEAVVYDEIEKEKVSKYSKINKTEVFKLSYRHWNLRRDIAKIPETYGWTPRKTLAENGFKSVLRIDLVKASGYCGCYNSGIPYLKEFKYTLLSTLEAIDYKSKELIIFRSSFMYPPYDFVEVYDLGKYEDEKKIRRKMIRDRWQTSPTKPRQTILSRCHPSLTLQVLQKISNTR